eukprot:GEZU01016819.1.p1 GENE.GEZU01016819.1~~GEZU01016819.1.p1  ORF type:complete len:173 (+),score=26.32 GEZU01016819.1:63-521(+)
MLRLSKSIARAGTNAPSSAVMRAVMTVSRQYTTGELGILTGAPEVHRKRVVRIYQPSKNPMQSAPADPNEWVLEFEEAGERWADPLMGWTSTSDPLTNMRLVFGSEKEAVNYADEHGFKYLLVENEPEKTIDDIKEKNYADKFKYVAPVEEW